MLKKIFFVIVLIAFLAFAYANGNAKDVSMDSIEKQLKEKTNIEEMSQCKNRDLMQFIGLNYEDYDSYIYYKGTEALSVDELLIIKVNSTDDLSSVKDAVDARIADQTTMFDGYGANQVSRLKNAIIKTKGNYLFYCVCDSPEKYEEVFINAI